MGCSTNASLACEWCWAHLPAFLLIRISADATGDIFARLICKVALFFRLVVLRLNLFGETTASVSTHALLMDTWLFCSVRHKYEIISVKLAIYGSDLWGYDDRLWVIVLKWWELNDQAYVAAVASVHMRVCRMERLLNVGDLMGVMVEEDA